MSVFKELSTAERSVAMRLLNGDDSVHSAVHESLREKLSLRSIRTLRRAAWLNDEVIDAFLALVQIKNSEIFVFSTFFWEKLNTGKDSYNFQGVRQWTRRKNVDIFAKSLVLVPVNLNEVHWILAAVDFRDFTISLYDSSFREFADFHPHVVAQLNRYLADEFSEVRGPRKKLPALRWVPCSPSLPQQLNDNDCGVFVCLFAAFLACGRIPDFAEPHELRNMRLRIAVAFCRGAI